MLCLVQLIIGRRWATKSGSLIQLIQALEEENKMEKIELIRQDCLKTVEPYIHDNIVRLGYLLTMATKVYYSTFSLKKLTRKF
jgi:hypothetical protein